MYDFHTKLAGTTFDGRDEIIECLYLSGNMDIGQELLLKREPNNPYDRNAIAVIHPETMQQIGFIQKDLAATMSPNIDAGIIFKATISSVTGGGGYNYGVNIRIIQL